MAKSVNKGVPVSSLVSLGALFLIFLRIACTSFGGFMAMIAVVQNAVVERRRLLSHSDMLDGISLASILPGPMAVNVVTYVGYRLRGVAGAFVSAFAAILPAFLLIIFLSIAYFRWGQVPAVTKLFMGFVPAMTAIIAVAAWNMGRKSITAVPEGLIAAGAVVVLLGVGGFFSTLGIVVAAAIIGRLWFYQPPTTTGSPRKSKRRRKRARAGTNMNLFSLAGVPLAVAPLLSFDPGILLKIFSTFAAMSLLLFGGAYVFIPMIQETVVEGYGWVSQQEFMDAVALGQITPGPILVSAAFIGFKVAGLAGAVVATAAIFLPAAALMVVCSGLLHRLKASAAVQAALRGVRPAVVGMICAAAVIVGETSAPVWGSALIFVTALIALLRFRVEAVWIVPPAGLLGLVFY